MCRGRSGVTVYGTGGTLLARHDSELAFATAGELKPITDLPPMGHPAHNFVDALRGQAEIGCTVADGRRAVALVTAAHQSAAEGRAFETGL